MIFDYSITGPAWASVHIEWGASATDIVVELLTDAPRNLLEAIILLIDGAEESTCEWAYEPGETRWRLRRLENDLVEVRIVKFALSEFHAERLLSDGSGQLVFVTSGSFSEFIAAIVDGLRRGFAEANAEYVEEDAPGSVLPEFYLTNLTTWIRDRRVVTPPA